MVLPRFNVIDHWIDVLLAWLCYALDIAIDSLLDKNRQFYIDSTSEDVESMQNYLVLLQGSFLLRFPYFVIATERWMNVYFGCALHIASLIVCWASNILLFWFESTIYSTGMSFSQRKFELRLFYTCSLISSNMRTIS